MEKELDDMTVRDAEVVGLIMKKEECTVPESVKDSRMTRSSVRRVVKRLVENDLVEEADKRRLPKRGRGKPSKVYRYVGPLFGQ